MEKFLVKQINNGEITLENIDNLIEYEINITFYDVEVKEGDVLLMHRELLDPKYPEFSRYYYFGPRQEEYGRRIKSIDDVDALVLISKDKEILLKRFYG